ncbi:MAG: S-layer homology domain-containing protein [Paenibacillaceae bacterium]
MLKYTFSRAAIILLSFFIMFSSVQVAHGIVAITDINKHWAKTVINSWIQKGFTKGYKDNTFKPDKSITRAEFIALINRSFGFTEKAAIYFSDATAKDWYYEDVAKAVKAGYTAGYPDGTVGANKQISREQAAVMIGRLLHLEGNVTGDSSSFTDSNEFASWSTDVIGAVAATKIMTGYQDNGSDSFSFKPANNIKRAEAIVSLDRALSYRNNTYLLSGLYGPETGSKTIDSNVSIQVAGVTLQNMIINGNLLISDGVGEGDATLKNVVVKGTTTINGGGINSIHLNNTILETVNINKSIGTVRIVAEGSTKIATTTVQSSATLEEDSKLKGAGFQTVNLSGSESGNSTVTLKGVFDKLNVDGQMIAVTIPSGSVQQVKVSEQASNNTLSIHANVSIASLTLNAIMKITGQGLIRTAIIGDGAVGASFEKQPVTLRDANGAIVQPTAPPLFSSVVAVNSGNNVGLGVGDSIVMTFNQNTNKPTITAANLNSWFVVNNRHSFGTSLSNSDIVWNATGNILTIGLSSITGTTFVVGDTIRIQAAAGLKNSSGTTEASTALSAASTGSFNSSPLITSVVAANTGNNVGLGIGDSVSITFNQNSNRPSIKAANLNAVLIVSNGHSFGTALSDRDIQWNATGNILTITFSNITGNTFNEGDAVTVSAAANIRDSNNVTEPSTAVSTSSSGSFTTFLEVKSVVAMNTGKNKGLGVGDKIVITFSTSTNHPTMTAANFKKWFIPTSGHSFGTNLTDNNLVWTSSDTLALTFTDVTGVTFAVGDAISINIASNIRDVGAKLPQNFIFTPQCTGSFSQAPEILSVVAMNTGNNEGKLAGDSVVITFDQNTNKPYIPSSTLNSMLILSGSHSFGTTLSNTDIAWNAVGNVLTVTFSNITGNTFVVGDKITISKTANIRDYTYITEESVAVSPASTGSFSPLPVTPVVVSVVASNTGKAIGLNVKDSIIITFSRDTNKPAISLANLNKWFKVTSGAEFGNSTAVWTANNVLTITFNSLPTDPLKYIKIGDALQISAEANIKDPTGISLVYSGTTIQLTGNFSTAPAIKSVKAFNTGNIGLGNGDTLEITFDNATNSPKINAENLRKWFAISNSHSFGTMLSDIDTAWDNTGEILTITFSDVTGSTIAYGDTIHVTSVANIMDATGEIKVSEALSPAITGSFTSPPKITKFYVNNPNKYDGILGAGDTISIVFDQLTNKPTVTASQLNDWFIFKNNSDKSTRKFIITDIDSVNWTTVDGQDYLNIVLKSEIGFSKTSIVYKDTYIDFKTATSSVIKDITSSIEGKQRSAEEEILFLVLDGSY